MIIVSPAFYNDRSRIKYLELSAKRWGVPVHFYGWGEPFKSWIDTHVVRLREELLKLKLTDHDTIIFADASDVICLAGIPEIARKYFALALPKLLLALEPAGLNAGCWMGNRRAALRALRALELIGSKEGSGDPQVLWRTLLPSEVELMADSASSIFQVGFNGWFDGTCLIQRGRICNFSSGTMPCFLHLAGGYSDQQTGKAAQVEPIWRQLGYE